MNGPPHTTLVQEFPLPGPLLGAAFRDLYLASEGTDNQKQIIGDPSLLPRPWDPSTCRSPQLRAELWAWLQSVVVWLNHEYTWDPDSMIPPCWPHHAHLVHELAVLADQRRRASIALDSNALEEWHRYTLPGFHDRVRARLKSHCDHDHQPWPSRGRHTRHIHSSHTEDRRRLFDADVRSLGAAQPTLPARPRLALLNTDTGEVIKGN